MATPTGLAFSGAPGAAADLTAITPYAPVARRLRSLLPLLLITAAHAGLIVFLSLQNSEAPPAPVQAPAVMAVMLSTSQPVPVQPQPPQPQERPKPRVDPKPVQPQPLPPIQNAPPSETAITAPEAPPVVETKSAPVQESAPVVDKAPAAEPAPPPPAPIEPPRLNASYLENTVIYPQMSRRLEEEGTVKVKVFVLPDGRVRNDVTVVKSSGFPRLDEAAVESVRRWRFVPARQGEQTIGIWHTVPVIFNLGR